ASLLARDQHDGVAGRRILPALQDEPTGDEPGVKRPLGHAALVDVKTPTGLEDAGAFVEDDVGTVGVRENVVNQHRIRDPAANRNLFSCAFDEADGTPITRARSDDERGRSRRLCQNTMRASAEIEDEPAERLGAVTDG